MSFKKRAPKMSAADLRAEYEFLADVHLDRPTDLNQECLSRILESVVGPKLLDAGCGRGFLVQKLLEQSDYQITGVDHRVESGLGARFPKVEFKEMNMESLEFEDNQFDTVICTHSLEHLVHFQKAVRELRRVCKRRLIVVVPRQRPYKYTFDLHLQFFPTPESLELAMGGRALAEVLGGDLYYQEDQ